VREHCRTGSRSIGSLSREVSIICPRLSGICALTTTDRRGSRNVIKICIASLLVAASAAIFKWQLQMLPREAIDVGAQSSEIDTEVYLFTWCERGW
jgi:hypothetical protein